MVLMRRTNVVASPRMSPPSPVDGDSSPSSVSTPAYVPRGLGGPRPRPAGVVFDIARSGSTDDERVGALRTVCLGPMPALRQVFE